MVPVRCGKRSSIRRMIAGGVAEPPMPTLDELAGSTVSTSGCSSSRTTCVVPPPHTLMPSCSVSAITAPASKRPSGQTLVAPVITHAHRQSTGPRRGTAGTWRGASAAGPRARSVPTTAAPRAPVNACIMRYDDDGAVREHRGLGRPVVPLVKISIERVVLGDRRVGQRGVAVAGKPAKSRRRSTRRTPGSPSRRARRFSSMISSVGR